MSGSIVQARRVRQGQSSQLILVRKFSTSMRLRWNHSFALSASLKYL